MSLSPSYASTLVPSPRSSNITLNALPLNPVTPLQSSRFDVVKEFVDLVLRNRLGLTLINRSHNSAARQKLFPSGPLHSGKGELDRYGFICLTVEPCLTIHSRHMYDLGGLPTEWTQYIHVDGKPYFRHEAWGVVTECYIRNATNRRKIESWYQRVEATRLAKKPNMTMSSSIELYLAIEPEDGYYYVDHEIQSIFWLEDLELEKLGLSRNTPAMSFGEFLRGSKT
jgi:hypothetical protein